MRYLVVQSLVIGGIGVIAPITASAAAGSLALGIFSDTTRTAKKDKKHTHAPIRQRNFNVGNVKHSPILTRRKIPPVTNDERNENALTKLYRSWMELPQIVRFGVAGNLANLGFFFLEKIIFRLLTYIVVTTEALSEIVLNGIEKYQDGMSFFSAYIIQIVTGHLLYAFLVYGMDTINTYEKYSKTLSGQFKVYGFGLFGATFLNSFLINSSGLDKTTAFWVTTATFAGINYFLVSWVVQRAVESSSPRNSERVK